MESSSKSGLENKYFDSCCCCLQDGCFKDISSEYYISGQKKVYEDMLKDTFNVQIYKQDESLAPKLCDQCISRLREASVFKQMVVSSQQVIREQFEKLRSFDDESAQDVDMLAETSAIKVEALPFADGGCEDDDTFDDDDILGPLKIDLPEEEEAPRNRSVPERRPKLKRMKIKNESRDASQTDPSQKDWRKILERRGNGPILRENSLKILANSTGFVFQWNQSRYRCFCCNEPFSDLASLRDHTSTKHTLEHIEKKIISQQNRLVKVEISTLNCTLCCQKAENLPDLRSHLTEKHNIDFMQTDDLLVPFKINGQQLQCQLCSEKFTVFRLLNIHMNRHYQKHVCHICGSGFSNAVFLNLHRTRTHRPTLCKQCDIIFPNKSVKKTHDITVHNIKFERKSRFPCPYCTLRFSQENFRVLHLVEKHGMAKPEHRCEMCSKVFITRSLCNNHIKTVHKKEKNRECDVCHKLFYNKSDVMRHRVTHTGEKKFSCTICNGPFATKDSLRRHLRRTHVGLQ